MCFIRFFMRDEVLIMPVPIKDIKLAIYIAEKMSKDLNEEVGYRPAYLVIGE